MNVLGIVYASQLGNGKAIAEDLYEKALEVISSATINCISDLEKEIDLTSYQYLIFIASTTG